jgi:hypothetical protein
MTGCPFYIWGHADIESSVNRQGLTHPCDGMELGKPVFSPLAYMARQVDREEDC